MLCPNATNTKKDHKTNNTSEKGWEYSHILIFAIIFVTLQKWAQTKDEGTTNLEHRHNNHIRPIALRRGNYRSNVGLSRRHPANDSYNHDGHRRLDAQQHPHRADGHTNARLHHPRFSYRFVGLATTERNFGQRHHSPSYFDIPYHHATRSIDTLYHAEQQKVPQHRYYLAAIC